MAKEYIISQLNKFIVNISSLKLNPNNTRLHSSRNLEAIKNSLVAYGQRKPIVVNERTKEVEAGNGMLQAAKALGWTKIAAVFIDEDDDMAKGYEISDNRTGELSEWNLPVLKDALELFDTGEYDLNKMVGYDEDEIKTLMSQFHVEPDNGKADEIPEVDESKVICKEGDLWTLGGKHKLLCGDCTDKSNIERLMDGKKVDICITDPPYGINIVKVGGGKIVPANLYKPIIGDDKEFEPEFILNLGDNQIIFGGNYFANKLPNSPCWIVWDKKPDGADRNKFADCEMAWTSFKSPARIYNCLWQGLLKEEEQGQKRMHPTQKPIKLLVDLLNDYTKKDNIIWDGFLGSGSTLIACEKTNRICYGCEIDPYYNDIIIQRFTEYAGKDAVRHDGKKWSELKTGK